MRLCVYYGCNGLNFPRFYSYLSFVLPVWFSEYLVHHFRATGPVLQSFSAHFCRLWYHLGLAITRADPYFSLNNFNLLCYFLTNINLFELKCKIYIYIYSVIFFSLYLLKLKNPQAGSVSNKLCVIMTKFDQCIICVLQKCCLLGKKNIYRDLLLLSAAF